MSLSPRHHSYLQGEFAVGIIGTLASVMVLVLIYFLGVHFDIDWGTIIIFMIADIFGIGAVLMFMFYGYKRRILK